MGVIIMNTCCIHKHGMVGFTLLKDMNYDEIYIEKDEKNIDWSSDCSISSAEKSTST